MARASFRLRFASPLAPVALATVVAAQGVAVGPTYLAGPKVETLVKADAVKAFQGGGGYCGMTATSVLADGDLIFHAYTNPGTSGIYHWESDTGVVTQIFNESHLGTATGLPPGDLILDSLSTTPSGEIWMIVGDWNPFGGGPFYRHVLQAKVNAGAPTGYSFPTSVYSYQAEIEGRSNLRANFAGLVDMVIDNGRVAQDDDLLSPGNGVYRWVPNQSAFPLHRESFVDIGAIQTAGGPTLTGGANSDDTGATNVAVGNFRVYMTMADTSDNATPNFDGTWGEAYDGDIVVYDEFGGAQTGMLIPRNKYLAVSSRQAGVKRPSTDNLWGIALAVDVQRNRLYTLEQYYEWTVPTAFYDLIMVLQWDLATGKFERVVATYDDIRSAWAPDGFDPHYVGGGFQLAANVAEGGLNVAPDGSLILTIIAESITGDDRILRITPADV